MKLTALALFLLIIVSSCTIEKRLHTKGWNVQWRKHHKSSNEEKKNSQRFAVENRHLEVPSAEKVTNSKETIFEKVDETFESDEVVEEDAEILTFISQDVPEDSTEVMKTVSPNADKSVSRRRGNDRGQSIGVVYIILGVIGVALAVGLYFSLSATVDIFVALLSIILMAGAGIIGLLLIIIGLVLIGSAKSRRV